MNAYKVAVSHPTGFHKGEHTIEVKSTPGNPNCRYASGSAFGCSRDYITTSDETAIRNFLREHGCSVVSIRKI